MIVMKRDVEVPLDKLHYALAGPQIRGPAMSLGALQKQSFQAPEVDRRTSVPLSRDAAWRPDRRGVEPY